MQDESFRAQLHHLLLLRRKQMNLFLLHLKKSTFCHKNNSFIAQKAAFRISSCFYDQVIIFYLIHFKQKLFDMQAISFF